MTSLDTRIDALISQLPLEAKVAQLIGVMLPFELAAGEEERRAVFRELVPHGIGEVSALIEMGQETPAETAGKIASLQRYLVDEAPGSIPALVHLEALNGFVYPGAVTFPTPIGLAATFRPSNAQRVGRIGARQMSALGINHAFSPVMDIARDARFGRVHETYGEDPTVCAAFAVEFVRGLQDGEPGSTVLSTGKHFLAYGLPEAGLNQSGVHVGDRELREVFATPFEAAIRQGGLATIMNSYSEIDGVPVAASREILTDLLRGELGFEGLVVADYGTVSHIVTLHGVARDFAEAGIMSLEAGLDIELPTPEARGDLAAAVKNGLVDEALVDQSLRRVLTAKARAGLFDGDLPDGKSFMVSFASTDDDWAAVRDVASESIVLLQNDGVLPLADSTSSIAVVGPFADWLRPLFASYSSVGGWELIRYGRLIGSMAGVSQNAEVPGAGGAAAQERERLETDAKLDADITRMFPEALTVAGAMRARGPVGVEVRVERGCDARWPSPDGIAAAVEAARGADIAVCVIGEKTGWIGDCGGGEGRDRSSLHLLGSQRDLVEAVAATGTPVVVVLLCGRPLEIGWLTEIAAAIVWAGHPGPLGAQAIADVLWGAANPGGKLPVSFPRSAGHVPVYSSHKMGSGYRRPNERHRNTYLDAPSTPVFAFGHGLSYSTFEVSDVALSVSSVPAGGEVTLSAAVVNTSGRAGDEVVQVYARDRVASVTRPVRYLVGFHRVTLAPGERAQIDFAIDTAQFALWNRARQWVVEPGEVDLFVATSSADEAAAVLLTLTGDELVLPHRRTFFATATTR